MKQIAMTLPCGNFAMAVTVDVDSDAPEGSATLAFIREGIARFVQNKVQPAWEEKEGIRIGLFTPVAGKKKAARPEKYVRKDIPYSDEGAASLAREAKGVEIVVGEGEDESELKADAGVTDCQVSEYTGASGIPAYKQAKDAIQTYLFEEDGKTARLSANGTPRTIELFASNRGLPIPTEPWENDTTFLAETQRWYRSQMKKQAD